MQVLNDNSDTVSIEKATTLLAVWPRFCISFVFLNKPFILVISHLSAGRKESAFRKEIHF